MSDAPEFRNLVAIVQKCLREYPNVTDAKDVARRVFARLKLDVDVATLDRALAAALEARDKAARVAAYARIATMDLGRYEHSINWSGVWENLAAAGLVPRRTK